MKSDIETILYARLFCLQLTKTSKVYQLQLELTVELIESIRKEQATYQFKNGFIIFRDSSKVIAHVFKETKFERIRSLPPITRRQKVNLYKWDPRYKNELISRGFSDEEHQRVKFISPGFFFISNKINKSSDQLYWVSKNPQPGYVKYRKFVAGQTKEFRQRKNKGKIYRISTSPNILQDEQEEWNRLHVISGPNPRLKNRIIHGDCLRIMKDMEDKSVDMIVADLPYGKFQKCHWDARIDLERFWEQIEGIAKPNTAILLFGKEPFSSTLRMSNQKIYRYDIAWIKNGASNFVQGNRMPLNHIENICVFYNKLPTYNPQKVMNPNGASKIPPKPSKRKTFNELDSHLNDTLTRYDKTHSEQYEADKLLPRNYLFFNGERKDRHHPTQKPLELLKYLIRTYSNEGDLILDPTCGSGTTCLAAAELGREYIGIEKELRYAEVANSRLLKARKPE